MDTSKLQGRQFRDQNELTEALKVLCQEDLAEYVRQCGDSQQFRFFPENQWIFLYDCIQEAGSFGQEYFFQDMWAAREIYRSGARHVYDIGSRMDGFIAHLLAMDIQVTMLDIRPFSHNIDGLRFVQTNAMDMSNIADDSMETISSLCALEHFGLGRYGDPVDYFGWRKALHAIKRKLRVGGTFYLSVPVGNEDRLEFNGHRIFNPMTIINEMIPELTLYEFSYIANWRINTCIKGGEISAMDDVLKTRLTAGERGSQFGLFAFKKPAVNAPPR